jgi:[acyl-carrier-protein] S-malonyltransferase
MRAFVFPGQGSQYIGMGKPLYESFTEAREVFEEVNETLKQNLTQLMFSGEEEDLTLTENAQPALMAHSLAVMRILERQAGYSLKSQAQFCAGHSLGEYAALCASGVYSLAATARLLKTRGQAMQQAVPVGKGGMAALIGATVEQAEAVAQQAATGGFVCEVANDNAPGQVVLSGDMAAIDQALEIAKEHSIKRALKLPVSAPFHSSLMAPAAALMATALAQETIQSMPVIPLISNVTATPIETEEQIPERLITQVTGRVRWVESMTYLTQNGVTEMVEIGAGKVLSGLMRRINKDVTVINIETPEDIEAYLKKAAA